MKKTAVLIYNSFCNFEFSVALEILASVYKGIHIKTTKNGLPTY